MTKSKTTCQHRHWKLRSMNKERDSCVGAKCNDCGFDVSIEQCISAVNRDINKNDD